jgi:hypothetical protein
MKLIARFRAIRVTISGKINSYFWWTPTLLTEGRSIKTMQLSDLGTQRIMHQKFV